MYMNDEERESLIDRYLNKGMSDDETTEFEIRILDDPELSQRVQLLEAFKQGLIEQQSLLLEPREPSVLSVAAWFAQPLSMAASLLVAVLGGGLLMNGIFNSQPSSLVVGINNMVLLEGTRNDDPVLVSGSGPYLLQIDAGLVPAGTLFEVQVRSGEVNETVFERTGLQAGQDGWVRLLVTAQFQGAYDVGLTWSEAGGGIRSRQFQMIVGN